MSPPWSALILVAAGVLAGVVGTAGGITTLVSYPALLLVGMPALPAAIANTVAVTACWPGSALASRPELAGRGRWLLRWGAVAAVGGVTGAVLLLTTPPGIFERLVPLLLGAGSVALVAQGSLRPLPDTHTPGLLRQGLLAAGLFLTALYNGYFGAGAGVLTLVVVLVLVDHQLPRANALKNMLIGAASVVSALTYVFFGTVRWTAVIPLAAGLFVGSLLGPRLARRLPVTLLRWAVAVMGIGFAVRLAAAPI